MAKKTKSKQLAFAEIGRRGKPKTRRVARKKRKIKETHVAEKKNVASPESEASYGALKAYVHIAGYSLERGFKELDWLLDDNRWKVVSGGFEDVLKFMASLNIEEILPLVEQRKRIAAKLKALQPAASNRAIAGAVKVDKNTVTSALGESSPAKGKKAQPNQQVGGESSPLSGTATASTAPSPPVAANAEPPPNISTSQSGSRSSSFSLTGLSGTEAAKAVAKVERKEAAAVERLEARAAYEARAEPGGKIDDLVVLAASGKKFAVILADPPWTFEVYSGKGKERSAERHYDTMSLDDIKALPVAQLAADDCALFLWGVCPEVPGALDVIKAWGFEFKTKAFTWIKVNPSGEGLHTGMGYWTRANSEDVWLATRGSPQRLAMDVHQVIMTSVGEHSQKPDEAHKRIERLLVGPYLELFARAERPGWTTWGNEVKAPIKIEGSDEQPDAKPLEAAE